MVCWLRFDCFVVVVVVVVGSVGVVLVVVVVVVNLLMLGQRKHFHNSPSLLANADEPASLSGCRRLVWRLTSQHRFGGRGGPLRANLRPWRM